MRAGSQPGSRGLSEKAKPGMRRHHHVKRIGGLAAMRRRIGERADDFREFRGSSLASRGSRVAAARSVALTGRMDEVHRQDHRSTS